MKFYTAPLSELQLTSISYTGRRADHCVKELENILRSVSTRQDWEKNMNADSNQDASFLMMDTDSEKPDCGWAPLYWNMYLGNVLAIRADARDLAIDDVRMMCYFARRKLQPVFEDALGSGVVLRTKQEVLDFITWDNMVKCKDMMLDESGDS